ncbi:MAG: acetate kinase [Deltaproteobacteria bacterium]|nr:MAG: acetate kinase [Deltaproteobacteria bacterium]
MTILVLNCGSSTLKFQLMETVSVKDKERKLARGIVDRIGKQASYRFEAGGAVSQEKTAVIPTHEEAVRLIIDWLRSKPGLDSIDAVGHRVVHGGDRFTKSVLIDDEVIATIEALCEIAPLHNPAALSGIRAARDILGASVPMVAAFDTSYHHSIPEQAALYAIPYELSQKHKIRRYGFHGLAHQYDIARYAEIVGRRADQIDAVTLHLGNGCSASAIRNGQSIDTSMGFTPLEGLVMGTRSGDLDPALVSYLARKEAVDAAEIEQWLNQRSGLRGLSGISNDMRELAAAYDRNPRARLAVEVFCYRARKYLGAYLAVLGGVEVVMFSGGIGENSSSVRAMICRDMDWCGLHLDSSANEAVLGRDGIISSDDSSLKIAVIHTDEEMIIARETVLLIGG